VFGGGLFCPGHCVAGIDQARNVHVVTS
jgi:hypothetical protein